MSLNHLNLPVGPCVEGFLQVSFRMSNLLEVRCTSASLTTTKPMEYSGMGLIENKHATDFETPGAPVLQAPV